MRGHSACAGLRAAVCVGSDDVAFAPRTACDALGVAAGPGHVQPQALGGSRSACGAGGDDSATITPRLRHAGGVSGAAAVAAFAGHRQGCCGAACCRWRQVAKVRSHAAPPWSTARDPLTPSCLVVRHCRCSRSAARCTFAPSAVHAGPAAAGGGAWTRPPPSSSAQRAGAMTDLACTALPLQRAARSRLHQAAAHGEHAGPAFVSVAGGRGVTPQASARAPQALSLRRCC